MRTYNHSIKPFFMVLARDQRNIEEKIIELKEMNVPFLIICGEKVEHPNVVYREARGKWDAINFGSKLVPEEADVVVLNDVDTTIFNFQNALSTLREGEDLVYCKVRVSKGPQVKFYRIVDPVRRWIHLFACGELMLIKKEVFDKIMPIPPCLAEDSYLLFKVLELGYQAHFCTEAYVETERTSNAREEEKYKTRTTLGIYQALEHTKPPAPIRLIYKVLPIVATLLPLAGRDGVVWAKGIQNAVKAYRQGAVITKF